MNRPNKEDYTRYWVLENDQYVLRGLGRYQEDLDKYCDDFEAMYDGLTKTLDTVSDYNEELERENKELKAQIDRYKRLNPDDLSWTINPCSGCKDYCYKNDHCKSNGGCLKEVGKETPKKPQLEGDGYSDGELVYDTWICPNCEESYEVDYEKYDYCPKCGQKIDWSEYEDEWGVTIKR